MSKITLRSLKTSDIASLLAYWFRSPPGFLESLGVDQHRLPKEEDMELGLLRLTQMNANKSPMLVIECNGRPVGNHILNQFDGNRSAVFHAHIWDPKDRGQGIAMQSYPLAIKEYFKNFDLEKIIFKTPAHNKGPQKVKERLGLKRLGEELAPEGGMIKAGTKLIIYEITPRMLADLAL